MAEATAISDIHDFGSSGAMATYARCSEVTRLLTMSGQSRMVVSLADALCPISLPVIVS